MPVQLLAEEAIYPSDEVLAIVLGEVYPAYQALCESLSAAQIGMEWRYYNDGKAWLCKCTHKKKTVFWLSVWEGYFQTGFFFTEKTREGVPEHLQSFEKPVGKLIPLVMKISDKNQLDDLMQIAEYKKNLK